jgi:Ca-activated chloride channel homolog
MVQFAHPEYLKLLLVLPAVAALLWYVWWRKAKSVRAYGDPAAIARMTGGRSRVRHWLRSGVLVLALACLLLAFANPRIGTKFEEVTRSGIDLMVAIDVSASMLAEDLKPNRMAAAKRELTELIENLKGDRVGIIVFSGDAYTQLPLTTDYSAAVMLTDIIDVGSAPRPGTAIGSAIERAMESFANEDRKNEDAGKDDSKYRAMIVITDGENHEDDPIAAAKEAASKGIVIHTIGMGSPEGAPIPLGAEGGVGGFKSDNEGRTVVSKLNETALREIAAATGGTYTRASNARNNLGVVFREIEKMEKKEFGTKQFTEYEDRFQYLLAAALILLVVELMLSEKRNRFLSRFSIFAPESE